MLIEIKNKNGVVLFKGDYPNTASALTNAIQRGTYLAGADLSHMELSHANIEAGNLQGADFTGTKMPYLAATRANLAGAIFDNTDMRHANFHDADLENSIFRGDDTRAEFVDFSKANFTNVDWWGEVIHWVPLIITGMFFVVMITPKYMALNCEHHSHEDWAKFDRKDIVHAARIDRHWVWWLERREVLLKLCAIYRQDIENIDREFA